ncbi:MAG: toll/interleukin-1 receptor domain-containing protein [bacterium]|nr:toll/interleukin-1 receptor domain-containing protein [bacterium]
MNDVFISYSRKDRAFAMQLAGALEAEGRRVWIDADDIPFGAHWWEEIQAGIESSNAAVFILSPDSVQSEICAMEINHILVSGKRLIPLLYRRIDNQTAPPTLAQLNWLFFDQEDKFDAAFERLLGTLDTDLERLRQHTRLMMQAREWEQKGRSKSLLLRGEAWREAEAFSDRADLTALQREFLAASRLDQRKRRRYYSFWFAFIGAALGVGLYVFTNFRAATFFDPSRVAYSISYGQIFGFFVGALVILADDLPLGLRVKTPFGMRYAARVGLCLLIGIAAWWLFRWYFYRLNEPPDLAILLGAAGLAVGFIAKILLRGLPGWALFLLTWAAMFVPIYITYQRSQADINAIALVYFEQPQQVFTVGLPMTLLVALGAHFHQLYAEAQQTLYKLNLRSRQRTA